MSLQELKEKIVRLPISDRLALMTAIIESLPETSHLLPERSQGIKQMRSLLKTDKPVPTDEEITVILEERRQEKYG